MRKKNEITRIFRVTAINGKTYDTKHYNLKAIISVGNKVDSPRTVQFRKWANDIIEEYTIKGFAMDDELLKNGGTVSAQTARQHAETEFKKYRLKQDCLFESDFDRFILEMDVLEGGDTE